MASTFFSRPKYNGRQANLGNTVLVNIGRLRKESDLWYLGYLQNIEDDQALIDLDCTQFPPFWISTQYVWYHHLLEFGWSYQHPFDPLCPPPLQVQAALRSEQDGPLVFRPAQLLNYPSVWNLYACCVSTSKTTQADNSDQEVQVVHHWQVVQSLPTDELSLFGRMKDTGSLNKILVLKQLVHTGTIDPVQIPEECGLKNLVFRALNRAGFINPCGISMVPRVFVEICKNSIMFLLFDLHLWIAAGGELGQRQWTTLSGNKFAAPVEEYLRKHEDREAPELGKCGLICIMDESYTRVCSVWHFLLRTRSSCIIIDFSKDISQKPDLIDASEGYYLGTLFDRAISQKTRALALYNIDLSKQFKYDEITRIMEVIENLLALKKMRLLAIILKNCRLIQELTVGWDDGDLMAHELQHISKLLRVCQKLFLINHTIFENLGCDCGMVHRCMLCGKIPHLFPVTFPYLEFHSSAGERKSIMQYVEALEPQLPSVDEIKARFKERHQFFVETLPYPDGWHRFRQFLRRHTFTELSKLDSFWNELDLRNFDLLPLTKMSLLPLDVCISLAFENVNV